MEKKINVLSIDCDYALSVEGVTKVVNFFLKHIEEVDLKKIIFSQIHANIYYTLDPLLQVGNQIDILSIDHHHDVLGAKVGISSQSFESSNWLGYYLSQPGFIQDAYWLCNYDSNKECSVNRYDDVLTVLYDFEDIEINKFDHIFVCISPLTANLSSYSLFNVLIEIVKNNKKCEKVDFYRKNILNHFSQQITPGSPKNV